MAQRDHGGDLGAAIAHYGGRPEDWVDLSTGINPNAYPLPEIDEEVWKRLPQQNRLAGLVDAARSAYSVKEGVAVVPAPGAQAIIQHCPALAGARGVCAVVSPTYNEHAAAFMGAGWEVQEVARLADTADADALVVVNPNNPDGQTWSVTMLVEASAGKRLVVVDESFADTLVGWRSIASLDLPNVIALRSFGKFYGLAGVRLGFALTNPALAHALADRLGPWCVSGPALEIGESALTDHEWAAQTRAHLHSAAQRLDRMATETGLGLVGGTPLYRLYRTRDAASLQSHLARAHIFTRIFSYDASWIRIGLPGEEPEWERLEQALSGLPNAAV